MKVMLITKCPHVNRKHYAKVITLANYIRTCVLAATGSMEGTKTPGTVCIRTDCCIQLGCARHAIFQTTTRYLFQTNFNRESVRRMLKKVRRQRLN